MPELVDDFETRAREVLEHKNPKLLADLLALRAEVEQFVERRARNAGALSAQTLNAQNQQLFDRAAKLLGAKNFQLIFGFPANQKVTLVDPAIYESANADVLPSDLAPKAYAQAPPRHPAPAPTVTLKHIAAKLAEGHEMSKKQAEAVLNDLVGHVVKSLKKGERIRIGGLGILQVRKRAARMGRNPATGEQIKIKASKKVAFRAAKELKEAV
jgi:DNA-binding protein HU-beta